MSDLILYTSDDGQTRMNLRVDGQTVWLTQLEIAELFQTTKQNVSLHAKNIFEESEVRADSVVKESLTTAADGKNYVTRVAHRRHADAPGQLQPLPLPRLESGRLRHPARNWVMKGPAA